MRLFLQIQLRFLQHSLISSVAGCQQGGPCGVNNPMLVTPP